MTYFITPTFVTYDATNFVTYYATNVGVLDEGVSDRKEKVSRDAALSRGALAVTRPRPRPTRGWPKVDGHL